MPWAPLGCPCPSPVRALHGSCKHLSAQPSAPVAVHPHTAAAAMHRAHACARTPCTPIRQTGPRLGWATLRARRSHKRAAAAPLPCHTPTPASCTRRWRQRATPPDAGLMCPMGYRSVAGEPNERSATAAIVRRGRRRQQRMQRGRQHASSERRHKTRCFVGVRAPCRASFWAACLGSLPATMGSRQADLTRAAGCCAGEREGSARPAQPST
jgi:hypothetical protein